MSLNCRLVALDSSSADALLSDHGSLPKVVESARRYQGLDFYWAPIHFLLTQASQEPAAGALITGGKAIGKSPGATETGIAIPASRMWTADFVKVLQGILGPMEPEALIPHFDPAAMDAAEVYPMNWVEVCEENDLIGNALEYFSYLREFVATQARTKSAALIYYYVEDGYPEV